MAVAVFVTILVAVAIVVAVLVAVGLVRKGLGLIFEVMIKALVKGFELLELELEL